MLLIECRNQDVRRHDRRHVCFNRRLERRQFDGIESIGRMLEKWQFLMWIANGVPDARKVLAARSHAFRLERANDNAPQAGGIFSSIRKGAIANRRAPRFRVHVEHRGVVERDAHGLQLCGQRTRKTLRQVLVSGAPQRDHRRPFGEGPLQPCDTASFLIDRDPQRHLARERLRLARQLDHLLRLGDVP